MLKLRYIGNGTALPGVPTRDLTDEQAKRHGGVRFLVSTKLYEEIKKPRKAVEEEPWETLVLESSEKSS
jgi:hypothetical protein